MQQLKRVLISAYNMPFLELIFMQKPVVRVGEWLVSLMLIKSAEIDGE